MRAFGVTPHSLPGGAAGGRRAQSGQALQQMPQRRPM